MSRFNAFYAPPRNTTNYIQLRFQLARFRVYRIVRLPLTFTFANLHTLIQYMFGWSDSHLHHAEVYPNVVLHDEQELLGTIKSCGRKRPLEDYELGDPIAIDDWTRFAPANQPIYRVQPKVTRRKDPFNSVMTMEEKGVTLESIWSHNEAHNMNGRCTSLVDKGISSTIWILPAISPFSNTSEGAPPIEHVQCDIPGVIILRSIMVTLALTRYLTQEYDAEDKTVSPRFFDVSYFQGYCKGKITSESRKTRLDILTEEEAEDRRCEYLQRQKEKRERIASGEQDEDEEEEDEDDEYFDEE
ncbi:hypothetical protein J3R83DRAFT_13092 [Lanmaoa asiatica]|nr:hypothetical protein J3R83DRAFT_13092 [Lanmaoa asiatica]